MFRKLLDKTLTGSLFPDIILRRWDRFRNLSDLTVSHKGSKSKLVPQLGGDSRISRGHLAILVASVKGEKSLGDFPEETFPSEFKIEPHNMTCDYGFELVLLGADFRS